ncbi:hypothetical protein CTI12_AA411260 [Artemisia annua]|uniref:Uncharacterized protein n=1 Tax=Artemisia annua TaxID=35608 RepID=A0A2U1M7J8_ARTAN|nr:hypothetical protein CTI12_AA411260 [Artemisia annua]
MATKESQVHHRLPYVQTKPLSLLSIMGDKEAKGKRCLSLIWLCPTLPGPKGESKSPIMIL